MKPLAVGAGILLACLALCIGMLALLDHYTGEAAGQLEEARRLANAGQFDEATAAVEAVWAQWQERRGFFGIVLRHDEADQVHTTFRQLVEYGRNGTVEEFEPTCADLIEQIRHLSDMEKPRYYNVLAAPLRSVSRVSTRGWPPGGRPCWLMLL